MPYNKHPPLLLNAIYSLSARFSNDPLIYTDPRRPYAAGDPFFNRAKRLLQNALDEPAVSTVQALLLMALGAAGSGKGSLGWLYTGMAIRMAQEMKMNVDYEDLPMVDKPLGWIDRETRRRIWWNCFAMVGFDLSGMKGDCNFADAAPRLFVRLLFNFASAPPLCALSARRCGTQDRCISAGADRPFTIDERDCLLSLPSDETIWEHTHSSFNDDDGSGLFSNSRLPRIPFNNTLPYTSPPPGSPPLSHFALNVVLCDILGKVLRYANNARRSKNSNSSGGMGTGMGLGYHVAPQASPMIDSELAILDASLRNWYRSLPPELTHPHLSGFPYNQHVWIGGYLHITYHAVLVILHRPSFPFPYGPLPIPQSEIGAATHNDPPNGPIASIYNHADEPGHPTILEPQLPSNNPVWPTPISRDVCTTSAERVGKILEEVIVPNPFLNRFHGFAAYCMFHTGVVHIINAVYPYDKTGSGPTAVTGDVAARARRFIKAHVLGLRRMTRFWSLSGRYLEALEHLMRANGLDKEFEEAVASEKHYGGIDVSPGFRADEDEEFGVLAGAAGMRPPSPDLPAAPKHRASIHIPARDDGGANAPLFDPSSPPSGFKGQSSVMDLGFPIDSVAGIGSLHPFYSSGHYASLKSPSNPMSPGVNDVLVASPEIPSLKYTLGSR